jgi:hypothetical protein
MRGEPPPETDAEFRVVHGPWPRWMLHIGLIKLIAWGAAMSALAIVLGLILLAAFGLFG